MSSGIKEGDMVALLHQKFGWVKRYNQLKRRYVSTAQVRNMAGFGRSGHLRTADFIAVDTWTQNRGPRVHGFEVKVTRSDWLAELKQPEKAEAFRPYCHHWWLVAPPGVVKDDLPEGWGLIEPNKAGTALVVRRQAPANKEVKPMPTTMLAALLRALTRGEYDRTE